MESLARQLVDFLYDRKRKGCRTLWRCHWLPVEDLTAIRVFRLIRFVDIVKMTRICKLVEVIKASKLDPLMILKSFTLQKLLHFFVLRQWNVLIAALSHITLWSMLTTAW